MRPVRFLQTGYRRTAHCSLLTLHRSLDFSKLKHLYKPVSNWQISLEPAIYGKHLEYPAFHCYHEEGHPMTDSASQFVSVHTLTNRFEADFLIGALDREGISAFVRSFEETPYDGLFISQKGWGLIMVPEESADRAKGIIQPLMENLKSKTIFTDPSEIDPMLWDELRGTAPGTICSGAQVEFDPESKAFRVPFLGTPLLCFTERETIEPAETALCDNLDFSFYLALLHYLLEAQSIDVKGVWISEKDIPGGELFFRGHHRLPIDPIKKMFGTHPELFQATSEMVDGIRMEMGDLAYQFRAFPRIPLVFVLWKGDEEFGPELKVLFDQTIHLQLRSLDTVWALVGAVSKCLHKIAKDILREREA